MIRSTRVRQFANRSRYPASATATNATTRLSVSHACVSGRLALATSPGITATQQLVLTEMTRTVKCDRMACTNIFPHEPQSRVWNLTLTVVSPSPFLPSGPSGCKAFRRNAQSEALTGVPLARSTRACFTGRDGIRPADTFLLPWFCETRQIRSLSSSDAIPRKIGRGHYSPAT